MSLSHDRSPTSAPTATDTAVCQRSPSQPNTAAADYPVAQSAGSEAAGAALAADPVAEFYYDALVQDPVANLRDVLFTCYLHNWPGFNQMLGVVDTAARAEMDASAEDPGRVEKLLGLRPGLAAGKQALRQEPSPFELDILLGALDASTAPLTADFVAQVYEGAQSRLAHQLREHAESSGDAEQLSRALQLMTLLGVGEPSPEGSCPTEEAGGWLDVLADADAEYDILTRAGGLMQSSGGAFDVNVGAAMVLAPVPPHVKLAGLALALHGLDDMQAGLRTALTGESTKTLTESVTTAIAEWAGLSPENAGRAGLGVDFAAGVFNPGNLGKHAIREAVEHIGREGVEHADDAARAGAKLGDEAVDGADEAVDTQKATKEGTEETTEEGAESAAKKAEKKRKTPNEVRGGCPIAIPKDATVIEQTKAAGYDQIKFRWDDGQAKYEARWHTRTPGAPVGQGDTWVVERKIHGNAEGKQAVEQVMLKDGTWTSMKSWKDAGFARSSGNATAEQQALLDAGHHPAN